LPGAEVARPGIEDLSLADEVVQGAEGLLQSGLLVEAVEDIQVIRSGLQPPEAGLNSLHHVAARESPGVDVAARLAGDLGRDDQLVAAASDKLAQDLLRLAARVDVGAIEAVDAGVPAAAEDRRGLLPVRLAPRSSSPGQGTRSDACIAQQSVFHEQSLLSLLASIVTEAFALSILLWWPEENGAPGKATRELLRF
jgi:hypothetical protein